jgi:hypothetical protein
MANIASVCPSNWDKLLPVFTSKIRTTSSDVAQASKSPFGLNLSLTHRCRGNRARVSLFVATFQTFTPPSTPAARYFPLGLNANAKTPCPGPIKGGLLFKVANCFCDATSQSRTISS